MAKWSGEWVYWDWAQVIERKSNMHQIKSELNCDSSLHCEGRSQMIVIQ